jgi:hypothetical protein
MPMVESRLLLLATRAHGATAVPSRGDAPGVTIRGYPD